MINMSDANISLLRSCLYKQTAIYYFIGVSNKQTGQKQYVPTIATGGHKNFEVKLGYRKG